MLFVFGLSKLTPNDPVLAAMKSDEINNSIPDNELMYKYKATALGLDKPVFYFDITPANIPDTLYKVLTKRERNTIIKLLKVPLDWQQLQYFRHQISANKNALSDHTNLKNDYLLLLNMDDTAQIALHLNQMIQNYNETTLFKLKTIQSSLFSTKISFSKKLPRLHWFGFDNQFHRWISNLFYFNFGVSYLDGRDVRLKIWEAIRLTLFMNILVLILAYGLAIPLSLRLSTFQNANIKKNIYAILFFIHSIPLFLIASFAVLIFTNEYYHLKIFPNIGLSNSQIFSVENIPHFILPVICISIPYIVHITILLHTSLEHELLQPYATLALSKGISKRKVVNNHVFKNAIFPLINMLSGVLPFLFVGSFMVELIFNLPGMGQLLYTSILYQDWPVVFAIIFVIAILIVIGNIIADILYTFADPRIKLD